MENRVSTLTATGTQIATGVPNVNGKVPDVMALLGFWKENKYPLVALNHRSNGKEIWKSAEFNAARERDAATLSSLRAEYVLVRNRWAQEGIPCIIIKSGGSFPSFPYTSDNLDILVHEEHEEAARAILLEQGYTELKNIEEPKKFLFRKFTGGECVSAIHLHTQVGWGVGFMDDDSLWERARVPSDDDAIMVPSPEDIILITVAHSFYENKRFRLADIVKIRQCCRGNMIDWEYLERVADQRGWLDGLRFGLLVCAHLEEALWGEASIPQATLDAWQTSLARLPLINRYFNNLRRRSPVSLPFSISFIFGKFLFYRKVLHDQDFSLGKRLYEVVRTLIRGIRQKSHIRPQSSFLVSFSGADGSGKTQHTQALAKCLEISELKTRYYWSRCATSKTTRLFSAFGKALLGRRTEVNEEKSTVKERRKQLHNPLLRFLWSYLMAVDMIFSNFYRVWLPRLRGKIVICDRYAFDAAAEMESSLPAVDRLNRLAIKLMLICAPKPDVAFLLDLPENVCTQRKDGNTDLNYLQRQREAYLELANRYHLRIKKTDREFSANADEILREVIIPYYKHFPTLLNGLFLSNPSQINRSNHRGQR